jgi:hypothetical protein
MIKTQRSPVKKPDEPILMETTSVDDTEHLHVGRKYEKKRKIEEISKNGSKDDDDIVQDANEISNKYLSDQLKTLFDLIASTSKTHSEEISSVKTDLAENIQAVSVKVNQIEADVSSLKSNVQNMEKKIDNVSKTADMNKAIINSMMQENLNKCMDIDGLDKNLIEKAKDLKLLALEIINSFNIPINADEIDRVSKKEIRKDENGNISTRFLLLVHFKDFETKVRILRSKMTVKDNRNIFFNATLTPTNRYFMMSAKKIAKKANLKVFFKSGKVNVEKLNKEIITIANDKDITILESYINEIQGNLQVQSTTNTN